MKRIVVTGKAYVCDRDDVDTDMIIPAKYLNTDDPAELAKGAFEFVDKDFPAKAGREKFGVLVSGRNFGCGSSREHAVWCLTGHGIQCVIADSFARIYFKNCVNYGLLPVVCPGARKKIRTGDCVEIDVAARVVKNMTTGETCAFESYPDFILEIIEAGGLLPWVKTGSGLGIATTSKNE